MSEPLEKTSVLGRDAGLIGAFYVLSAVPELMKAGGMPPPVLAATIVLGATLAVLSAIDLRTFRLPDALTLPLLALGLLLAWLLSWPPSVLWRAAGAAAGYFALWGLNELYRTVRGRAGLGLGDAKLLAAAGAWLGLEGLPSTLLVGCIGALIFVSVRHLAGHALGRAERLPFGPFLAAGFWLVWLYGPLV